MSIIVNSRISFVFALMKCSFAAFGEQNKIDNDSKCQQVYKFLFYSHNTKTAHTSNSELFAILLRTFVHHNTTNRPCGGGWCGIVAKWIVVRMPNAVSTNNYREWLICKYKVVRIIDLDRCNYQHPYQCLDW